MKSKILNEVFAEFCESQTHFDSLLSEVNEAQKSRVATLLGAFLRRPLTLAKHFGIQLEATPAEFWSLGFIRLKKHPGIHAVLGEMWEKWKDIPRDGGEQDFPPELVQEWQRDWGPEGAARLCKLLSQDPLTTIRFHRRAFTENGELLPDLQTWLQGTALPKSRPGKWINTAHVFRGFATVQRNEFYHQGYFEIQDEGSQVLSAFTLFPQEVAPLLAAAPVTGKPEQTLPAFGFRSHSKHREALRVVDACAGAGGKTLALSDMMDGRGRVFAYDVYEKKIRALKIRLDRARENNVQAVLIPEGEAGFLDRFEATADVVLVDSPCSGLGVLRRNPDIKWNRKPLELHKRTGDRAMPELQSEILGGYSKLVKPGGRVVYGVCTFSRSETTETVERFLKAHSEFELESMGFVGPYDTDGFFMASMKKR